MKRLAPDRLDSATNAVRSPDFGLDGEDASKDDKAVDVLSDLDVHKKAPGNWPQCEVHSG